MLLEKALKPFQFDASKGTSLLDKMHSKAHQRLLAKQNEIAKHLVKFVGDGGPAYDLLIGAKESYAFFRSTLDDKPPADKFDAVLDKLIAQHKDKGAAREQKAISR